MANPLSWHKRVPLLVVLIGCVLPLLLAEQRGSVPVSGLRTHERQPQFQDWSTRHALYSRYGTMAALEAARRDPRAQFRWREMDQRAQLSPKMGRLSSQFRILGAPMKRPGPGRFPLRHSADVQRDWSVYIGTAGTAPGMYPAKYTFDTSATPSCTSDFIVFPENTPGGATQPSLVAFNNLYSGKIGTTNGFCNGRTTGVGITDVKTSPTVMWSYSVNSIGGAVTTSPVLSLDGTKVAFVESASGNPAHFHVLAWKSGDGVGTNLQNAVTPVVPISSATAPASASGKVTDLVLGSATTGSDTLSSPFVDYGRDQAYIGTDNGTVFRIKNVFCILGSCGGVAPSIDTTWGGGPNGIATGCGGKLTGPVMDFVTSNVYLGCSDGKLYSISQAGVVKSLVVGDGVASKTYGAIVDPPLVDGTNGFVYVTSGSAAGGTKGVLVQSKMDLTSPQVANIGLGNQCNTHAPTPNNAYFTSITSAGALMYVGGLGTTGTITQPCTAVSGGTASVFLYAATFGAGGTMNAGTPAKTLNEGPGLGYEWVAPLEFFNTSTATDLLFIAAIQSSQNDIGVANITAGFPTGLTGVVAEGVGLSGMVVDNSGATASFPQAASIYFNIFQQTPTTCANNTNGTNTGACAVKLTQALQ